MKIKTCLGIIALCSAMFLVGCNKNHESANQNNDDQNSPTLIFGTNAEFAPFESHTAGGEITGFDIDIINAMAKNGHFKVTFKDQPWDSLFASLNNGDLDAVVSGVTITDDRKKNMDFTEPYFNIKQVVLMPKDKAIHSAEDLKTLNRIGVANGQTGDFTVQKILGAQNTKIARFENIPLVLKELEDGGVDAVVADSAVIDNYVKNTNKKDFNIITIPDFEVEHYAIAVRKGNTETQRILNDALNKIKENGEYQQIYNQYFAH